MRAVVQRVKRAAVEIDGETVAEIEAGMLVLVGVGANDSESDAEYMAEKIANLRIFEDDAGKMNLSVMETGGGLLVVSQFTLYGDCRKGRRPSFTDAAEPEKGEMLYDLFVRALRARGAKVQTGRFSAGMLVKIENDGPVTFIVES